MRWYIPQHNGDFRLEAKDDDQSLLIVQDPTLGEEDLLKKFIAKATKKKWTDQILDIKGHAEGELFRVGERKQEILFKAPIDKVGSLLVKLTKPKKATLTAVRFEDGKLVTIEGTEELGVMMKEVVKDKEAKKAATVKRPTPSCPQCMVDAIGPATEALLSFLSEEQHETWRDQRFLIVVGGRSQHRYLLAHRNSRLASKLGRICYDLDDRGVLHFHDWGVPPEEEILAAKLILEGATTESWLRNEATCLDSLGRDSLGEVYTQSFSFRDKYKNPFGGLTDGVADAGFTQGFGGALLVTLIRRSL